MVQCINLAKFKARQTRSKLNLPTNQVYFTAVNAATTDGTNQSRSGGSTTTFLRFKKKWNPPFKSPDAAE
jgi:hypothetical protein